MSPLLDHLRRHADNVAVHTDSLQLSYAELADRVQTAAAALGDSRRLVLLETRNDVDITIARSSCNRWVPVPWRCATTPPLITVSGS